MRGVVCALCLFAGGVSATPIASYNGVSYQFTILLPCRTGTAQIGISEIEELAAATQLAQGDVSAEEFLQLFMEADPRWVQKIENLRSFARSCHDVMPDEAGEGA